MKVFDGSRLLAKGAAPVSMEPVRAAIRIEKTGSPTVRLLDHVGCPTNRTLPISDGRFEIDGERDQTPYYLVEY